MEPEVAGSVEEVVLVPLYKYRLKLSGLAIIGGALAFGGVISRTVGTVAAEWFVLTVVIIAPAALYFVSRWRGRSDDLIDIGGFAAGGDGGWCAGGEGGGGGDC